MYWKSVHLNIPPVLYKTQQFYFLLHSLPDFIKSLHEHVLFLSNKMYFESSNLWNKPKIVFLEYALTTWLKRSRLSSGLQTNANLQIHLTEPTTKPLHQKPTNPMTGCSCFTSTKFDPFTRSSFHSHICQVFIKSTVSNALHTKFFLSFDSTPKHKTAKQRTQKVMQSCLN